MIPGAVSENDFKLFSQCPLFENIPESQLHRLYEQAREVNVEKGSYLFREGDASSEFFIILEGSVEIKKYDAAKNNEYVLNTLHAGESIGEMALIGNDSRSTSVLACTKTRCLAVSFETIQLQTMTKPSVSNIFIAISKKIGDRLRYTNEVTVKALEDQVAQYRMRVSMANFVIMLTLFLVFYILTQLKLSALILSGMETTRVGILFLFVWFAFIALLIKLSGLTYRTCGITLHDWKRSVIESVIFTLPILLGLLLFKWILLKSNATFLDTGNSLFAPFVGFRGVPRELLVSKWVTSLALYCLVSVPLQELIVRGALQTALEKFLISKHKTLLAVLVSNAIFGSFHAVLSVGIALLIFIPGLFFGWLYSRHHNLIGVCLSHAMIGAWFFWIVGVWVPA